MFDFQLIDLETIISGLIESNCQLCWYWLTYGYYWINTKQETLFQLSDEYINSVNTNVNTDDTTQIKADNKKYMDYEVVRLWEDIIEILPTICLSVPDEFHQLFLQPIDKINEYYDRWFDYTQQEEQKLEYRKHGLPFTKPCPFNNFFFDSHDVNLLYIDIAPFLYLWRYKNDMWIAWDFTHCQHFNEETQQQIPIWTATKSTYHLPFDEFIQELNNFHQKFMTQMEQRIGEILQSSKLQKLYPKGYNFSQLIQEHEQRKQAITEQLKKHPVSFDWEEMIFHHQQAGILI